MVRGRNIQVSSELRGASLRYTTSSMHDTIEPLPADQNMDARTSSFAKSISSDPRQSSLQESQPLKLGRQTYFRPQMSRPDLDTPPQMEDSQESVERPEVLPQMYVVEKLIACGRLDDRSLVHRVRWYGYS